MRRIFKVALVACMSVGLASSRTHAANGEPAPSGAPVPSGEPAPSEGYRVSVLTMGPGDDFVSHFGHDAFLVERAGLPALVYNFGTYTEQAIAPHHVLGGTLRYFLSVDYFVRTLALYRAQNRSVVQQVLALDRATAERLALALSVNSRPANATYAYDFARDNCTTRVRDVLDRVLDGALKRELRAPSGYSYREHALRFTARDPALALLFDVGLGAPADRPLDAWDDAFLPDRLAAYLRRARVNDANGAHPLVRRELTLFSARRAPTPERAPVRAPYDALAAVASGALVFATAAKRHFRVTFALACSVTGACVGGLGLFVLVLLGTKVHPASHQNYNALVCPALALLLVPSALRVAVRRTPPSRWFVFVAASSLALSLAGTAAALWCGQQSSRVAALALPLLTAVWLGARRARRTI